VVETLNGYFVPLYVENEEAERILLEAGRKPYSGQEWQLVQTHLIMPSGELLELWRPGHNTGGDDPESLLTAMKTAITDLGLPEKPALPAYRSPRPTSIGEGAALIETVLRFPSQENFPRNHAYTIDWINLSADDIRQFIPSGDHILPTALPSELAAEILIHLRPPLDDAKDPQTKAMALVKAASLQLVSDTVGDGSRTVGFTGSLELKRDQSLPPAEDDDGKWSEILHNDIHVRGFVKFTESGALQDLQLVTVDTVFSPPNGKEITYNGMARLVAE
jgi:hypothetical protein